MLQNIVQIYNDDDVRTAVRSRDIRQRVGTALAKRYPRMSWLVDVNMAGGIVTISSPAISARHGMVVHLTHALETIEARALQSAGELLERFGISRVTGDATHIKRKVNGEAQGANRGEL